MHPDSPSPDDSSGATPSAEGENPASNDAPAILPFRTSSQLRAEEAVPKEGRQVSETGDRYRAIEAKSVSCLTFDLLTQGIGEPVRLERCIRHYLKCLKQHGVKVLESSATGDTSRSISLYYFYYLTMAVFLPRATPLRQGEPISERVETYFSYCTVALRANQWTLSRLVEE